ATSQCFDLADRFRAIGRRAVVRAVALCKPMPAPRAELRGEPIPLLVNEDKRLAVRYGAANPLDECVQTAQPRRTNPSCRISVDSARAAYLRQCLARVRVTLHSHGKSFQNRRTRPAAVGVLAVRALWLVKG